MKVRVKTLWKVHVYCVDTHQYSCCYKAHFDTENRIVYCHPIPLTLYYKTVLSFFLLLVAYTKSPSSIIKGSLFSVIACMLINVFFSFELLQ